MGALPAGAFLGSGAGVCQDADQPLRLAVAGRKIGVGVRMTDGQGRIRRQGYSVVVKNRGAPSNPWEWEIYRAGKSNPIWRSPIFFRTMVASNFAGKAALKRLLFELSE